MDDATVIKAPAVDSYREELFDSFFKALPENFKPCDIASQVRAAYDFAYSAHYGVFRRCGEKIPYITHPVAVALIVANEIGLGVSSVVAALLHDVVEDCDYTHDDIQQLFGESIANIVDGLTKITNVYDAKHNAQSETFKKMLLSIPQDSRVSFIKIADRLHNMRTMDEMPDGTRQIKAGENLYVYVPIAEQLGLYDIKNELEDTSFKYTHPLQYQQVVKDVTEVLNGRTDILASFKLNLLKVLLRTGITTRLAVVNKSYFQIWSSMRETGNTVDQVAGAETVRVIFDPPAGADEQSIVTAHYNIYATIISNFPERSDSKRDYVINPKKNGFKALVFQVMFKGHWIEVQVITSDNDQVAHRGYSSSSPTRTGLDKLKNNLKDFDKDQDAVALLNRFRSLSLLSTIFVFTPKGSIVELPTGATVLDFAYAIHTRLGNHCLGAHIDQKIVPINHVLKTTEQVTVLTSPSVKPSQDWLNFVKSERAKSCLDKYFKRNAKADRSDVIKGKQDFNKLLRDNRIIPNLLLIGRLLSYYKLPNNEEFYRMIATNDIKIDDLLKNIRNIKQILDGTTQRTSDEVLSNKRKPQSVVEINYKKPLNITKDMAYVLSPCCCPIAGDDAVCHLDEEGILYIHRRDCVKAHQLIAINGKQTTKVLWDENLDNMMASVNIQGTDRIGLIKDMAEVFEKNNVSVKQMLITENDGIFSGTVQIAVRNTQELDTIIESLRGVNGIVKVNRTFVRPISG
ncbi:MAG: HD domain-containing protein [Bacteroidales bacterium]|nr:HD domain-containing protein [Bacteroidales bacterium]